MRRTKLKPWSAGICTLVLVIGAQPLHAKDDVLTLLVENDVITGTDRHYTSGVLLSYTSDINSGPKRTERLGRRMVPFIKEDDLLHVGISIGNELYTPSDIRRADLIPDDRPYAGYVYGALDFSKANATTLNTFRLNLGMVGPSARGERIQSDVHRAIDSDIPKAGATRSTTSSSTASPGSGRPAGPATGRTATSTSCLTSDCQRATSQVMQMSAQPSASATTSARTTVRPAFARQCRVRSSSNRLTKD